MLLELLRSSMDFEELILAAGADDVDRLRRVLERFTGGRIVDAVRVALHSTQSPRVAEIAMQFIGYRVPASLQSALATVPSLEVLRFLLCHEEAKWDQSVDHHGALRRAVAENDVERVRVLLDCGAVDVHDAKGGASPYFTAVVNGRQEILRCMFEHEYPVTTSGRLENNLRKQVCLSKWDARIEVLRRRVLGDPADPALEALAYPNISCPARRARLLKHIKYPSI